MCDSIECVRATFSVRYSYVIFKIHFNDAMWTKTKTDLETRDVKLIYANLFKSKANVY